MNMSTPNISELIKVRNSLLFDQRELYVSAATNINMRYRELLKNDFGLILVKNCAWDVADRIVCQYFDAQDFYISPQQMAERIINFSYDNETDPLMYNSAIRKMMYESKNGESLLNDIADKSQKAQQTLFQKEKYVDKNGKEHARYKDHNLMQAGKQKYRDSKVDDMCDELSGVSERDVRLEVDHVEATATATYNTRYMGSEKAQQALRESYNSNDNFRLLSKSANASKGDVKVFSDGNHVVNEPKVIQERKALSEKYEKLNKQSGMDSKQAKLEAKAKAKAEIESKYKDITYKATAKQRADAECERWENAPSSTKENLIKCGILDENGFVPDEVREKTEEDYRKSMNEESKVILRSADYEQIAKDAGLYTVEALRKIFIGQVIYYILPPLVFETNELIHQKGMTIDQFLKDLKKRGKRLISYVNNKIGAILKGTGANALNKFIKSFFDIIIEILKETVKRFCKIAKQLVLSMVNCVRIIVNKQSSAAEKADAITRTLASSAAMVLLETLFEYLEDQFALPNILMEPLQIIVTILATNLIMLILQKADLFDVQYGLLVANIERAFEEESQIYLEKSTALQQQTVQKMEGYMASVQKEISEIEQSIQELDLYSSDIMDNLNQINIIFDMGIDFNQEWQAFTASTVGCEVI